MIRKWHIRFAALLEIAILLAIVFLAFSRRPGDPQTLYTIQEAAWQAVPRLQIFFAMHALIFSVLGLSIALFGFFVLWPPARWFALFGVFASFLYYRIEPRYDPADLVTLVHALGLLFVGAMFCALFLNQQYASAMRYLVAIILPVFITWSLFIGLLPKVEFENFAVALDARLKVFALIIGGGLLFASFEVLPCFRLSQPLDSEHQRRDFRGMLYFSGVLLLISGILLSKGSFSNLVWLPAIPFVPAFMAVYAPYLWFSSEHAPEFFATNALNDERSRFFLGVLFQYLTLGMLFFAIAAFRSTLSRGTAFVAYLWLFLYWLPAIWFAWALSTYQMPS